MKIGVDIDGVLADFQTSFLGRATKIRRKEDIIDWPPYFGPPARYDMTDIMEPSFRDGVMFSLQNDRDFWVNLKALKGISLFKRLCKEHKVVLLTARTALRPGVMHDVVRDWIKATFGLILHKDLGVVISPDKVVWMTNLDAYIDDNPEVLAEVAKKWPKTKLYLRDQLYNRKKIDQNPSLEYDRVATFDDFARAMFGEPHWHSTSAMESTLSTQMNDNQVRTFSTGATRDTEVGKFDYEGFLSPLVLQRFAAYMHKNREQKDGSLRASDNWQKGIPKDAYLKSAIRHLLDWWLIHDGFEGRADVEEALCGVLFNAQGYLLETLREKK